ncbi:MAG: putative integral rane protein [Acidobacteria bacterium]|nr:putative integral rane protein [Acidobacteriota bacterium]
MHSAPPVVLIDYLGPVIGAVAFVVLMSLVKEPSRHRLNAILAAGASGVYLSGGFGPWELVFPAIVTPVIYVGLRSYRFIGVAWLMHSCWDIVHHLWGNPIWPFMPTSSFGCMIFDAAIALWLLAEAPSIFAFGSHTHGGHMIRQTARHGSVEHDR